MRRSNSNGIGMAGCSEAEGKEQDSNPSAGAERGVLTVAILISGILAVAITSHLLNPKLPDGREFSEGAWYSTDVVHFCQRTLSGFDDFLAFVSSASNPAQILHRVVPLLASVKGPQVALKVLVAYVAADVSNLALKWPLQGDRPFWMDREIRQFGGNTCEVGFGMPSGHVQVTVASYAVLASSFKNTPTNALVFVAVVLTAVSRVHMGAHTPLQVTCGGIAGIATALSVGIAEKAIIDWASHRMSNNARLAYAGAVTVTIIAFIAMENALLLSQGINIYASVSYAISACRGGLHAVVSSARGIARDVGALLGGILGLCWRYRSTSAGVGDRLRRVSWIWTMLDVAFAVVGAEVGLLISAAFESVVIALLQERGEKSAHGAHRAPDMPGGGTWLGLVSADEGAATVGIFAKYLIMLTWGVGFAPLLCDRVLTIRGAPSAQVKIATK